MTPGQVRQELGELLVQMSHQDAEEPSRVVVWTKALISYEHDLDWADREVSLLRKAIANIYRALAKAEEKETP